MRRYPLLLCMFCMLLPAVVGCGEIDLPVKEDNPPQEVLPDEDKEQDHGGDAAGGGGETADPEGVGDVGGADNAGGAEEPGDGSDDGEVGEQVQEQRVGKALFTADGHVLIDDRLYLSIFEIRGVVSAYNVEDPTAAVRAAAEYAEGNLDAGWRIPTEEEVSYLRDMYASSTYYYGDEPLPLLNRALEAREYEMISLDMRYLCAEGEKTFNFELGKKVTKAGAKTTYRLRLVHDK